MAKFTNTPPEWKATGVAPDNNLKEQGFTAGYKPPATFFNWFWNKVSNCLKELLDKSAGIITDDGGEIFNDYENNIASGEFSHAEGYGSRATGIYAHAEGTATVASEYASHAEGVYTTANAHSAHAEGLETTASGTSAHAEGKYTTASGDQSHCEGYSTRPVSTVLPNVDAKNKEEILNHLSEWQERPFSLARGESAHTEGANCLALGDYSHSEGSKTIASGDYSHSQGEATRASGKYSHSGGVNTEAKGFGSIAEGDATTATGYYARTYGKNTTATGNRSCCEGNSTNKVTTLIPDISTAAPQLIEETWETSKFSLAHGSSSHAQGEDCVAGGNYSLAGGKQSIVTIQSTCGFSHGNGVRVDGENAFAVGQATQAGARAAVAMGVNTQATDQFATALGSATKAKGIASMATGRGTVANGYGQFVAGKFNAEYDGATSADDTSGSVFIVGVGTGDTAKANAFRITNAGKCMGSSSFSATGADYAECFEWVDGNKDAEDRRGYFVTFEGDKIRKASAEDNYILGVISVNPSVIGNAYTDMWHGMYLTDVFGERLTETVKVAEKVNEETGEVIPAHTETRFILNPEYDHTQPYVGRDKRKEWAYVGTHGQLIVIDDGSSAVHDYCKPNNEGIATKSDEKTAYYVIERLDENHIKVFVK